MGNPSKARPSPRKRAATSARPSAVLVTGDLVAARPLAAYESKGGIRQYVSRIRNATPLQLVEAERSGVKARLVKDLANELKIPVARFYGMLDVPKATIEAKVARDELVGGAGGQRALAMVRLLGLAQDLVSQSRAPGAAGFDTSEWLGEWIETPQPALGGRKPADLLDTPTGFEIVSRTLGALESGSYL